MQREGTGGARKVISNCIILAVKMGRPRWKQLASLIYVMNNAHRASMGLKRAPQDVYRVALSISLHLCARAVTACTNQQEAKQSMQFCMPALHKVCQIISYGVVVCSYIHIWFYTGLPKCATDVCGTQQSLVACIVWSKIVQCNSKFPVTSKLVILLIVTHELLQVYNYDVKCTVIVVIIIITIIIILILTYLLHGAESFLRS